MDLERVTGEIVDSAVKLHMALGPGLFESAYDTLLAQDLVRRGFSVERQKLVSFEFQGLLIENAFRVDLLVNAAVVVEVKSLEKLAPVHMKQVLTYLRLLDLRVGLLLNFGAATLIEGIHRIVNRYTPPPTPLLRVNRR
jgi:GxxExxY protein